MGQAFNRLGTKVYIVDRGEQILGKEDKDMADGVMNVMRSEGVVFHLNASIEAAKDLGSQKQVVIKNAEGKTIRLNAETILVAMGRSANVQELGLEDIGVQFDKRSITVDKRLRTNHKHLPMPPGTKGALSSATQFFIFPGKPIILFCHGAPTQIPNWQASG